VCTEPAFVPIDVADTPCALDAMRLADEDDNARCAVLLDGVAFDDCAASEGAGFAMAFLPFALAVLFAGSALFGVRGASEGKVEATCGRLAKGGDAKSETGEVACDSAASGFVGSGSVAAVDGDAEEAGAASATCGGAVLGIAGSVTDFSVSGDDAVDPVCGHIAAAHVCARS